MKEAYYYLNGQIIPSTEAKLPLDDISILRGYGVFDFLRTIQGKPFHLEDHFIRLNNSARILDLEVPITLLELKKVLKDLLDKNNFSEAGIRMVLTGGQAIEGINFSQPNFFILIEEWNPLPAKLFQNGAKLISCNYCRPLAEAKNTNYMLAVKKQKEKNKCQALEILYLNQGNVLEASTSNFFAVINNRLVTPREDILPGVTRKIVLDLAQGVIEVREDILPFKNLRTASECFITATNKDIVPVVQIDDFIINNGCPGLITTRLLAEYRKYINNYAQNKNRL